MTEPADDLGSREERRTANAAILLLAVIVLALNNLPYIWGWRLTPKGQIFQGIINNVTDYMSYLAKMRQGMEGAWRYTDRYTTEPHHPSLLFFFYILLGHVARWSGFSLRATYHSARIVSGLFLMLGVDRLGRTLEMRPAERVIAFFLAFTACGFGWLLQLTAINTNPPENWWQEAYAFQSMINFPHFALSTALVVWGLNDLYRYAREISGKFILSRLLLWIFLLVWVHPRLVMTFLVVGGTAALLGRLRLGWPLRKWIMGLAFSLAVSIPPSLMIILSYRGDPVFGKWAETITSSPPIYVFEEAYGLLWPLAIYGAYRGFRSGRPLVVFFTGWLIAGSILPYLPIPSQRRLIQGLNLPLAILSAYALASEFVPRLAKISSLGVGNAYALVTLICVVMSIGTAGFLYTVTSTLLLDRYPWYYSTQREEAFNWLSHNTSRDDVVICDYLTGMVIPALSGNRVVAGHWAETLDSKTKVLDLQQFYNAATLPEERDAIIRKYGVRYIFYAIGDAMQGRYNPASEPKHWRAVMSNVGFTIYQRMD